MIMEDKIKKYQAIQDKGKLLYQSQWKQKGQQKKQNTYIYQKVICCESYCIVYEFDLRITISEKNIIFIRGSQEIQFQFCHADGMKWRSYLKRYLNQTGFHQNFKPIKKIGKGNFASVFLVHKYENGGKYAVKAFSKQAAYSEQKGKQCLIKQIQIMRRLQGKHNMKLQQVFQSQNSLYIVFQLLQGGQLLQKIKNKQQFTPKQIQKMVKSILQGLYELHSKGIMHRDLKPDNILIRTVGDYDCVIADYGLSQMADEQQYLFVRCGTPGFVAPEVINIKDMNTKYTVACDMFSLGLIIHLLVFGKSLFVGKTYNQILAENRACKFQLTGPLYQSANPLLMDLMKKMLRVDPLQRVSAEYAMDHPYFKQQLQQKIEVQADMDEQQLMQIEDKVQQMSFQNNQNHKKINRDSCLQLKLGKQNILTGNTKTVQGVDSKRISGFNVDNLKGVKVSKFVSNINK